MCFGTVTILPWCIQDALFIYIISLKACYRTNMYNLYIRVYFCASLFKHYLLQTWRVTAVMLSLILFQVFAWKRIQSTRNPPVATSSLLARN